MRRFEYSKAGTLLLGTMLWAGSACAQQGGAGSPGGAGNAGAQTNPGSGNPGTHGTTNPGGTAPGTTGHTGHTRHHRSSPGTTGETNPGAGTANPGAGTTTPGMASPGTSGRSHRTRHHSTTSPGTGETNPGAGTANPGASTTTPGMAHHGTSSHRGHSTHHGTTTPGMGTTNPGGAGNGGTGPGGAAGGNGGAGGGAGAGAVLEQAPDRALNRSSEPHPASTLRAACLLPQTACLHRQPAARPEHGFGPGGRNNSAGSTHRPAALYHEPVTTKATAEDVHAQVQKQFGATAAAYTTSAGHSNQSTLRALVALAAPRPTDTVLDVATGAGHTALAFAPHVARVVACDLTEAMLAETAKNAARRELGNVITRRGPAETLPFGDAAFDIATVRLASHHFADNGKAVREMARVARPGGRVVVVDNYGPEDEALDDQLQNIEKLRDPSHVRSYRLSVWRNFLEEAGLSITREVTDHYSDNLRGMNFDDWVRRSRTPPERVEELHRLLTHASAALRDLLKIEIEPGAIWFRLPQVTFIAVRP